MSTQENLKPGDLCVIINNGRVKPHHLKYIGLHVILLSTDYGDDWRTTRLGPLLLVHRDCLRKIPPAPIEEEEKDLETLFS